jgi:tRNA pseudouridine65 synthase
MKIFVQVVFCDDALLVVEKPTGIHTHNTHLSHLELSFQQFVESEVGERLFTVHRLDRATSGILIFARTREAARLLQEMFATGRVKKTYLALVRGWLPSQEIEKTIWDANKKKYLQARTVFEGLSYFRLPLAYGMYPEIRLSLVRVLPQTGRWHQIRLHAHALSHPIIGDAKHGDNKLNRMLQSVLGVHRLWLHAQALDFIHPITHQEVHLESTQGFEEWLNRLKPFQIFQPFQEALPNA